MPCDTLAVEVSPGFALPQQLFCAVCPRGKPCETTGPGIGSRRLSTREGNVGGPGGLLPGTRYSNYSQLRLRLFKSYGNVVGPKHEACFQVRRHSVG